MLPGRLDWAFMHLSGLSHLLPSYRSRNDSYYNSQFGFNLDDVWIGRRDTLLAALHSIPKAKWVTRVLQFGSEPLFDNVLPHAQLAQQVIQAKSNLSSLHIPVTVSEFAYG